MAASRPHRDAWTEREKCFRKWYGWQPVKGKGAICPRRVAGKHCVRLNSSPWRHRQCICEAVGMGIWDHCALWKDEHSRLVFTSEPYHIAIAPSLVELVKDLQPLGLEAHILPRSGWNPNNTILLAVTRPEQEFKMRATYWKDAGSRSTQTGSVTAKSRDRLSATASPESGRARRVKCVAR
jgi:hypothetical protein